MNCGAEVDTSFSCMLSRDGQSTVREPQDLEVTRDKAGGRPISRRNASQANLKPRQAGHGEAPGPKSYSMSGNLDSFHWGCSYRSGLLRGVSGQACEAMSVSKSWAHPTTTFWMSTLLE